MITENFMDICNEAVLTLSASIRQILISSSVNNVNFYFVSEVNIKLRIH
jgi:hypothetical protein